jgi:hypothetical protein
MNSSVRDRRWGNLVPTKWGKLCPSQVGRDGEGNHSPSPHTHPAKFSASNLVHLYVKIILKFQYIAYYKISNYTLKKTFLVFLNSPTGRGWEKNLSVSVRGDGDGNFFILLRMGMRLCAAVTASHPPPLACRL